MKTITELTDEFTAWCESQGITPASADELLADTDLDLSYAQRQWLHDFIERWEFTESYGHMPFHEVLEIWLDMRAKDPIEFRNSEKYHWRQLRRLSELLDSFVQRN